MSIRDAAEGLGPGAKLRWLEFRFRYLGLAALVTTTLVFLKSTGPIADIAGDPALVRMFLLTMLLVGAFTSAAIFFVAAFRPGAVKRRPVVAPTAGLIAGIAIAAYAFLGGEPSGSLVIGGGVVAGLSVAVLTILWGHAYSTLDPERAIFYTAVAMGLANVLNFLIDLLVGDVLIVGVVCALPLIAAFPLRLLLSGPAGRFDSIEELPQEAASHIASIVWIPIAGASLCALIMGLVWDPFAAGVVTTPVSINFGPLVARLTVAVLLAASVVLSRRGLNPTTLYQVALPVVAAFLLVVPFIDLDTSWWVNISGSSTEAGLAFFDIAAWSTLVMAAHKTRLSPSLVFGAGRAVLSGFTAVGLVIFPYIGLGGQIVCLVLTTLYLVAIIVSGTLRARTQAERTPDLEEFLAARCADLSKRYRLSRREAEVFFYLARGRSPVFIGETLGISENTVRTHVRRIHEKTGVHSREEIINLIDTPSETGRTSETR